MYINELYILVVSLKISETTTFHKTAFLLCFHNANVRNHFSFILKQKWVFRDVILFIFVKELI